MCLHINNTCNKKLHVEPILAVVPANQRMIRFPVRVKYYTDYDLVIDDIQPVYKITCPDEILKKMTLSNRERDLLTSFDFSETEYLVTSLWRSIGGSHRWATGDLSAGSLAVRWWLPPKDLFNFMKLKIT